MSIARFANGEFDLQMIPDGDSFKVIASGVAKALGLREGSDLVRTLPDAEKGSELVPTPGGVQRVWVLREPGFYRAIGQRQAARVKDPAVRAQVERFQSWVYGEVIPQIRRTGRYEPQQTAPSFPVPRTLPEALRAYASEVEAHGETREQVRALEPSATAWNTLAANATGDYSVREAAQILDRDPAISTGQNRLFAYLRDIGWIDDSGQPYQQHVDAGRLVRRTTSYSHPHSGEPKLSSQVRITAKGVRDLRVRLGGQQTALDLVTT